MAQIAHGVIESQCRGGGVILSEAQTHRHAHPEVLRHLQSLLVRSAQEITVDHSTHAHEPDEVVTSGVEGSCKCFEVEISPQSLVKVAIGDELGDRAWEIAAVQILHPLRIDVA